MLSYILKYSKAFQIFFCSVSQNWLLLLKKPSKREQTEKVKKITHMLENIRIFLKRSQELGLGGGQTK